MTCTTTQLAQLLNAELLGSPELTLEDAQPVELAEVHHVTFATDKKNLNAVAKSAAGAVLISKEIAEFVSTEEAEKRTFLIVDDALISFVDAIRYFRPQRELPNVGISEKATVAASASIGAGTHIHERAVIGEEVVIGENCRIMSGAVIGDGCQIGNDVTVYPNVVFYHDLIIGDRVIIHANAVLGADGFGFRFVNGRHEKIPQLGIVRIENDVEIGASTNIDRAMAGETVIGEGTKLDDNVMIGHNCQIGKHNVMAAQTAIGGSTTTGDYVVCGGQVGISDHAHIGDGAILGAKCGVSGKLEGGKTYLGMPAEPVDKAKKTFILVGKLPEMRKQLRAVHNDVAELKAKLASPSSEEAEAA